MRMKIYDKQNKWIFFKNFPKDNVCRRCRLLKPATGSECIKHDVNLNFLLDQGWLSKQCHWADQLRFDDKAFQQFVAVTYIV
jgi:hypothetical protein